MNNVELELPIKSGVQSSYDTMYHEEGTVDNRTIYICTDTGNLYFGKIQLCTTSFVNAVSAVLYDESSHIITIKYSDGAAVEIDLSDLIVTSAVLGTF